MKTYPICLVDLDQRQCVVIGGGKVAARKVQSLLEAGARVTVISPQFDLEFGQLIHTPAGASPTPLLTLLSRPYLAGDLRGATLVIAATDDSSINQAVWEEACRLGCLVNVVDDPMRSNFIVPAVIRRGELTISISTGGASPALARRLREHFEAEVGPEYGQLTEILAELRPALLDTFPPGSPRLEAALALLDCDLLTTIRTHGVDAARVKAGKVLQQLENATRGTQDPPPPLPPDQNL